MRYLGLFFFTGSAGILSSFVWLIPNGFMAAALGMSLSTATVWLGLKEKRLRIAPGINYALGVGAVAGLFGGLLMALLSELLYPLRPVHSEIDFGPPKLPFWGPVVMGILYGMVLQRSYYIRRLSTKPLRSVLWSACLWCFLLKAIITFLCLLMTDVISMSNLPGMLIGSMMISLFGAVPFALLWMGATAWLDPAWKTPSQPFPSAATAPGSSNEEGQPAPPRSAL